MPRTIRRTFKGRRKVTPEMVARIRDLRRGGMLTAQIAEVVGCASPTVSNVLRRHGEQAHRWLTDADRERIYTLRSAKVSTPRIASELGISRGAVMAILRQAGLTDRRNGGRAVVASMRAKSHYVHRTARAIYARENGWPENVPPPMVRILNLLIRGPATRPALAAAAGVLPCRVSHYLGQLAGMGWVAWIHTDGAKRLYSITLAGLANWSPPDITKEECHG